MTEAAKRSSWKVLPEPEARVWFDLPMALSKDQASVLRRGLIPEVMEDKWFVFFEEGWLTFCRSWTGACIFGLELTAAAYESKQPLRCWASREGDFYRATSIEDDKSIIRELVDMLLRLGAAE